ncbi:hypothetical protein, partial [Pseudomonas aeruginosa]|uniref:hypothetical protein n=1 Tax=Pseudomonas aeruginosa TaxID=287 RepID=UPI001CA55010
PLLVDEVETPEEGEQYIRKGKADGTTEWAPLEVDAVPDVPTPNIALAMVRKDGEWKQGAPIVIANDVDKHYVLKGKASWVETDVFKDAASDGKSYARKDGAWAAVVPETTNDDKLYARKTTVAGGSSWVEVPAAIIASDAPDAKNYTRSNGEWKELVTIPEPGIDATKVWGRQTTAAGTSAWVE